jgi:mono/diheme cytochrome c family protein
MLERMMVLAGAVLVASAAHGQDRSIWDGVYTEEQAERGAQTYTGLCSSCHGRRLDGAPDDPDMKSTPPVARARFLRVWDGATVGGLFAYTKETMPTSNPGFLSDQDYVDVIAYMMAVSDVPPGQEELPPDLDALSTIMIDQEAP